MSCGHKGDNADHRLFDVTMQNRQLVLVQLAFVALAFPLLRRRLALSSRSYATAFPRLHPPDKAAQGQHERDLDTVNHSLVPRHEPADVDALDHVAEEVAVGDEYRLLKLSLELPALFRDLNPVAQAPVGEAPQACGDRHTLPAHVHDFSLLRPHGHAAHVVDVRFLVWRAHYLCVCEFVYIHRRHYCRQLAQVLLDSQCFGRMSANFYKRPLALHLSCKRSTSTAAAIGPCESTCYKAWLSR